MRYPVGRFQPIQGKYGTNFWLNCGCRNVGSSGEVSTWNGKLTNIETTVLTYRPNI